MGNLEWWIDKDDDVIDTTVRDVLPIARTPAFPICWSLHDKTVRMKCKPNVTIFYCDCGHEQTHAERFRYEQKYGIANAS